MRQRTMRQRTVSHLQSPRVTLLLFALSALLGCGGERPPAQPVQLTFQVQAPPETPAGASVSLVGSAQELGGDSGPGLVLSHEGGGLFSGSVSLLAGQQLTYRLVLNGSAAQVELDADGRPVPPRQLSVPTEALTQQLTVERWGPEAGLAGPVTTFLVQVPSNTPAGAEVWLSGNQQELGNWSGAGVQLVPTVEGRYATTLAFPAGTVLEYKVTRGGWSSVEKGSQGEELANRTLRTGERPERVPITVASWADFGPPRQGLLTGNIQYLGGVTSQFLAQARDVIIYLPPDYESNPSRRYPVLYMHDGQNLMDETTSFAGEWSVDETAQRLILSGEIEPLIIVGVYNTQDRIPEYTPVVDPNYAQLGGGKAADYARFLVEELKPRIDSTYRTRPEPEHTGVAGSSLGGLVSMYLGITHSNVFHRLGVLSPSVFWGDRDIVTRVNALPGKLPLRVWVDIGTEESTSSQETVEDTRLLRDALLTKGWVLDADLRYLEVQGGRHNEPAWSARFGEVLKYLYPRAP